MIPITRILLSQNEELKKFFFSQPQADGSIYFGSSLPKKRKGLINEIYLAPGERYRNVLLSEFMQVEAEITKYSYHQSPLSENARIHLKTKNNEYLFSFTTKKITDINDFLSLCTIILTNPSTYAPFNKKKGVNDIILPIDHFNGNPFCCEIFLVNKNYDYDKILQKNSLVNTIGLCDGSECHLVINLFHKKEFIHWPDHTFVIISKSGHPVIIESNVVLKF